ncbi:hypothetical protein [Sporisorium scitamineum]|uniref:Uncharacterized protein n=1 Tax=Sporisorium scitamineum TaxID=49012 RepID=A0A0F7RRX3_9BASI|nr:hypothetical protein [Sporisorium scitamineum]
MAIRDTWLYGEHRWRGDGRKGSGSTVAVSPIGGGDGLMAVGRKSFLVAATAVGLDEEDQQIQRQQRLRGMGSKRVVGGDAVSVVSLSLTEEIALYTSDVKAVEYNASRARTNAHGIDSWPAAKPNSGTGRRNTATAANTNNANSNSNSNGGAGAFAWNIPDWTCPATTGKTRGSQAGLPRLPERSPAPALMITDLFSKISTFPQPDEESPNSAPMQRVESGSLDPTLSPQPAYSPTLLTPISKGASDGHSSPHQHRHSSALPSSSTLHWSQPQWNTASPFRPDAPAHPSDPSRRPSFATTSYHDAEDQSPTAPNFPPASPQAAVVHSAAAADAEVDAAAEKRRATTYYDASWLPAVQEVPSSPTTELPIATRVLQPTSPSLRSPLSPKSPKSLRSFGHSETPYELRRSQRRTSIQYDCVRLGWGIY